MKPYKLDNKKRRILKKLYLGEFAMQGFEISCETTIKDFDSYDAFVDEFIDYIDDLGLCFGGGGLELFEGFLCAQKRYIYGSIDTRKSAHILQRTGSTSCVSKVRADV